MKKVKRLGLMLGLALPLIACGQQTQKTPKQIKQIFEKQYQQLGVQVKDVKPLPIKGWYEITLNGNQIVYVDQNVSYMMQGDLVDLKNKKNLTEERLQELSIVDYKTLPLQDAVTEVRGNGQAHVVVFSDPDCPYCKRLEAEFAKMTDVSIHTFLLPMDQLHPQARAKSIQIWCQQDKTAAWIGWMRENKTPKTIAACDTPLDRNEQLAQHLGFNGTPTLVFPNGKSSSGYLPMPQLQEMILRNQK